MKSTEMQNSAAPAARARLISLTMSSTRTLNPGLLIHIAFHDVIAHHVADMGLNPPKLNCIP